uniref:Transposon MuDR mudrA n=1 Tax=Solanum tuberosum TaxID=4113 RepID=M1DSI7_SOLTU
MLIENGSYVDMGESGSSFNTRPSESENFNFGVGEDHLNSMDLIATFSTSPPFTTTPPFNTTTADGVGDDDIDVGPTGPDFSEEEIEGSDNSTEDSVEAELVEDDDEEEYGSDVHEEVRELRAEKRSFQRRKRRERVLADDEEVPVGEVGPDLGFDEIEIGKVSHEGRLGGDEPYFASFDEDIFELDEDECCDDNEHESGRSRRKTPSAPSEVVTTKRGRGRGRGNTSPEKRPRVMGMGVFQAANGFKVMNPGMPSTKIYSTGQAKVTRSSDVTGDIGYTPSNTTKLKWNGVFTYGYRNNVVLVMCFTNGVVLSMLKYEWMTRLLVVDEVLHINTSFN